MRPLKRLSQNFLRDPEIAHRIVQTACIQPGETVIEIGPGTGALTRPLLDAGARVIAIEVDERAVRELRPFPIQLIHADVMTLHLPDLIPPGIQAKVVANLPYHLTSPILEKIVPHHASISQATLMVQKEVALRCAAQAGSKTFGHLTLFLQFYSTIAYCFEVNRRSFFPVPEVDSAIIQLTLRPPALTDGQASFFQLTRAAMGQRRKMVRNSLGALFEKERLEQALHACGLTPQMRPEQISLEQFLRLHQLLQ
jgi:16S rRNA (adenine1518-N6/adenine1519-N6)-dimethyltransferase